LAEKRAKKEKIGKKMRQVKYSVFFIIALLLIGCNSVKELDKSEEYKNVSHYDESLRLPSDMPANTIENVYPIPKVYSSSPAEVSMLPPRVHD
jgi:hypothetical protein